ncbi:SMR domain-containing protein At5g58720 isoform X3 [Amborella trichopoda]|uniref:SMR domain-containing protein At5g58720 isoform X3 n=1 Tax=Amborella trichopoda TaxID=13333 RepID=UPI0009C0CE21|nr:SMR domain-containing protein At5g58720 isoform X3 [Amborella trichopoda]|eukprot:XP_020525015.1 SMR domain-containing protein At5g58720 isoform X3 [Amborella trichopoda]
MEEDESTALNWLVEAFPFLSIDAILSAYCDANGDAAMAAQTLQGHPATEVPAPNSLSANGCDSLNHSSKKKKNQKKKEAASTSSGTVSSVLGKGYIVPSVQRVNSKPLSMAIRDANRVLFKCSNGETVDERLPTATVTTNSAMGGQEPSSHEAAENFLCSMLGEGCELNMVVIKDVLCHCGYDIEKTVDQALELKFPQLCKWLYEIPQSAEYNSRDDSDLMHVHGAHILSHPGMCEGDPQQKVLETLFNIPESTEHEPKYMDWKSVTNKLEASGEGLKFQSGELQPSLVEASVGKGDEYKFFRKPARLHWDDMKSLYKRAATAYTKGEWANAAHLSEKGRACKRMARKAEESASKRIFELRNKGVQNEVTIDLHGQHVKEALRILKFHITLFTCTPVIQRLRIITGRAAQGVARGIKQSVINLLQKEGIGWEEENVGTIVIRLEGVKDLSFEGSDNDSEARSRMLWILNTWGSSPCFSKCKISNVNYALGRRGPEMLFQTSRDAITPAFDTGNPS